MQILFYVAKENHLMIKHKGLKYTHVKKFAYSKI